MGVLGRGELARRFVIGKLSNQRTMLQRYHRRQSDTERMAAQRHVIGGTLAFRMTMLIEAKNTCLP